MGSSFYTRETGVRLQKYTPKWQARKPYKAVEYETISVEEYEQKYKDQQIKYMKKKAGKLGFQLVPV